MSEAQEQAAVVEYCDILNIPVYHVPNGGLRNAREAANLKRQGVKAGVPDLCIPVARGGFHGLYIEMKTLKGKPTDKQLKWLGLLRDEGYAAYIARGAHQAERLIDQYMSGNLERTE